MIHKQPIIFGVPIQVPNGSNVLKIAYQGSQLCFWYHFDPEEGKTDINIKFAQVGTGWDWDWDDTDWIFIDSVFDGPFVWHIFAKEI